MSRVVKWVAGCAIALLAAVLLMRDASYVRGAGGDEGENKPSTSVPPRVSLERGETIIRLEPETQARIGLAVAPLRAMSARRQIPVTAVVLPVQGLVKLKNDYVAAQSRLFKAQVRLNVTRKEHERLSTLYQEDQNISQKDLQTAEAAWRADQEDRRAAQQELRLARSLAEQDWGQVVGGWLATDPVELESVLNQRERFLAVTLPRGKFSTPPSRVSLRLPGAGFVSARLISLFPQTDPRIQGIGFLYAAPSRAGLVPGVTLAARFPEGPLLSGVLVPEPAVVWWQGKAWVYVQEGSDGFVRREVPTDMPIGDGFFVNTVFSPGEKIVWRGAQMLLSEEFRSQTQGTGGQEDTD